MRRELARFDEARDPSFRWRGGDVSRVEAISDAVFGFAVTLVVVSLEAPASFADLKHEMASVPIFAASFAILLLIWFKQYRFFRRFGLEDVRTTVLNFALLFVVLIYVYPLKFLFTTLFQHDAVNLAPPDYPALYAIYSCGYIAQNVIFILLYRRALAFARELELTALELYEVGTEIGLSIVLIAVSALVPVVALFLPDNLVSWTGLLYLLAVPAARSFIAIRWRNRPVTA